MNLRIEYDSYKIKDDITIEEIRLAIQYIQIKRETGKVSKDTCYKEEIYYGKRIKSMTMQNLKNTTTPLLKLSTALLKTC